MDIRKQSIIEMPSSRLRFITAPEDRTASPDGWHKAGGVTSEDTSWAPSLVPILLDVTNIDRPFQRQQCQNLHWGWWRKADHKTEQGSRESSVSISLQPQSGTWDKGESRCGTHGCILHDKCRTWHRLPLWIYGESFQLSVRELRKRR